MSTTSNKSDKPNDDESGAGATKATLLKEPMNLNASNKAEEYQITHQDADEEDDIQPIPSSEGQIIDRIE